MLNARIEKTKAYLSQGRFLWRIQKFLHGVEEILESLICEAVRMGKVSRVSDGGLHISHHVRWWNPAAWVAWIRVVVFRDLFGSYYYGKQDKVDNAKDTK